MWWCSFIVIVYFVFSLCMPLVIHLMLFVPTVGRRGVNCCSQKRDRGYNGDC